MGDQNPMIDCFLWATAAPRDVEPLIGAIFEVFAAFDQRPSRMYLTVGGRTRPVRYSAAALTSAIRAHETCRVHVLSAREPTVEIMLFLREYPPYQASTLERPVILSTPATEVDDARIIAFLQAACAVYPVAHGGILRPPSREHATAETWLILNQDLDAESRKRISFDSRHSDELTKLRRLYPVTIIGPAIWATLPPLPATDPPLVVRDLADCKMITAWPTLTDPHDLDFLLGTRDLRRWLWPYTIGNPADDPANTDNRLKWAERIPW